MIRALLTDRNAARWVIPFSLIGLGLAALGPTRRLGRTLGGTIDASTFILIGVALILCEILFVLPWSTRPKRCCPRCNCLNDLAVKSCAFCGREWVHERGMVYDAEPDAVPVTGRRARLARVTSIACAILAALVALMFLERVISAAVIAVCLHLQLRRVFRTIATHSTVQALKRHDGANCVHCLYPLGSTMQRCPECGEPGDARTARWTWARAGLWMPTRQTSAMMKQDQDGRERTLREGPATGARGSSML